MTALLSAQWGRGLVIAVMVLCSGSCRHKRFPSRGDAAAVVVVAPRADAAGPPPVAEQEPNDSFEQAQLLSLHPEWPVLTVQGALQARADAKGMDVDVFKVIVPARRQASIAPSHDASPTDDPRLLARRLTVDIAVAGNSSLSLQVLDDGFKSIESVVADPGDVSGMPNLAVFPDRAYYVRVRAPAKPGKTHDSPPAVSTYNLAIQIGDFEVSEEREPNGTLETAQPLSLVGTADFAGLFGWTHDQDFYRIPAPEVVSALDIELDAVEGVAAGVQVLDGVGARIAVGKGRKGERLALHNVTVPVFASDAGASARSLYVVLRGESGHNRTQRYVVHLSLGTIKQGAEIEPNDAPASATQVHDGVTTGFLPVGDVDFFRYAMDGKREVTVEVDCPSRVRGQLQAIRLSDGQVLGSSESKKARQTVFLAKIPSLGEPLLVRVSQGKGDGNPNEPYTLRISSALVPN